MLFIFLACLGISNPNTAALTLAPFTKNAGSASALMGDSAGIRRSLLLLWVF
jgi:DHA1 family bicyclomycin/chloramphenicol resistance-like MFS transporter